MSSPTQHSLQQLRHQGHPLVQHVEKWNPHARIRQDLFGIVDVLAVVSDIVTVQTTSAGNVSKRINNITELEALPVLRKAGSRVLVHSWRKHRARSLCPWAKPEPLRLLDEVHVYSHHSDDPLGDEKKHDTFDLFVMFDLGGDVRAVTCAAAQMLGLSNNG